MIIEYIIALDVGEALSVPAFGLLLLPVFNFTTS